MRKVPLLGSCGSQSQAILRELMEAGLNGHLRRDIVASFTVATPGRVGALSHLTKGL